MKSFAPADNRRTDSSVIIGLAIALTGVIAVLHMICNADAGSLSLIVLGLLLGIRNRFRKNAWWILIAIGVCNMLPAVHLADRAF